MFDDMKANIDIADEAQIKQYLENLLDKKAFDNKGVEESEAAPDFADKDNMLLPFKGNLLLSENQMGDLLDKMGLEAFDEYVFRLSEYIKNTGHTVKSHYATILKWYTEDMGVKE